MAVGTQTLSDTEHIALPGANSEWVTIVWDDPVNLINYVVYVFQTYFGFPRAKAEELTYQVHETGQAIVSSGSREQMEKDVQAMHSYGLWATLSRAGEG